MVPFILAGSTPYLYIYTMKPLRVMVVEDDSFARTTLKAALQLQGVEVIHDTSNVTSAIKIARTSVPDAAVIDLDLGSGPNGIDLAIGLRKSNPAIGIVLLTGFVDPRLLDPAISKLPRGSQYLVKQRVPNIEAVLRSIEDSVIAASSANKINVEVKVPSMNLPSAQLETLRLIAQGYPNERIARERGINEKSVEQAISRLVSHFGLDNAEKNKRVELARIYFQASGAQHGDFNNDAI